MKQQCLRRGAKVAFFAVMIFVISISSVSCTKETITEKEITIDPRFGLRPEQRDKVQTFITNNGDPILSPRKAISGSIDQLSTWRSFEEKEVIYALHLMAHNAALAEEGAAWLPSEFGQYELVDYYFAFYQAFHQVTKDKLKVPINHLDEKDFEKYLRFLEKYVREITDKAYYFTKTRVTRQRFSYEIEFANPSQPQDSYLWHPYYQNKHL